MAHRGIEPVLPGYTGEDGFRWSIDGIERCLPKAEQCGVVLALENHWGLARTPEGLLRILKSITSPWLGALMDTGNFLDDPYESSSSCSERCAICWISRSLSTFGSRLRPQGKIGGEGSATASIRTT